MFLGTIDKVCNDYHDNPEGDKKHTINWSSKSRGLPEDGQLDLSKLGLKDELSMRVRVGRNLLHSTSWSNDEGDRINFEDKLGAFAKLIADETYGGAVYSMTPNEEWKEVTGEDETLT